MFRELVGTEKGEDFNRFVLFLDFGLFV
jgi:hypothetical protein